MSVVLRQVVADTRWLLLALGGALVANIGVYAFVVRPLAAASTGASDRARAAAVAVAAAEREHAVAEALLSDKQRADEGLDTFYRTILPGDLGAARRLTYTSLPAMAARANVRYQRRRFDVAPVDEDSRLSRMTIRMELQGQYENLRQLIYDVERAPQFVIIDDMALTEQNPSQPVTLAITLSTYFSDDGP
jgi:hypothetical protein